MNVPDGDAARLWSDVEALGCIGAGADGGVTRLAWTPALREASAWLARRCESLGLATTLDAAGNVVAVWGEGEAPRVTVGSHIDTVRCGGRFDGALGVLCGLEAIALLREDGHLPRRPIALVAWMDEEGSRFATPTFGSRAFAGHDLAELSDRLDADGVALPDAMAAWERPFDALADAAGLERTTAYLELHVEQGRILERADLDAGVVTAICGLLGLRVRFHGRADHAGATPMDDRRDALLAAARAIVAVEAWASAGPPELRATVGTVEARPGSFNVIPGEAAISIDVRVASDADLARAEAELRALAAAVAAAGGVEHEVAVVHALAPVPMDATMTDLLERTAAAAGAATTRLPSGAGHDAMHLAPHVPTGMLFVPSRDGISHNPREHTDPAACQLGARVLADALRELSAA
jgi:hydantoinase/carbamoylase family amidase